MKRIKLTQGKFAIINNEDFELIKKWKWCAGFDKHTNSFYAISNRHAYEGVNIKSIKMSRLIMEAKKGEIVDHINHNTLDNRRKNLRICSHSGNQRNRKPNVRNSSGFKGVSKCTSLSRRYKKEIFQAQIRVDGKLLTLGYGEDKKKLASFYNKAAVKYFGEFAYLNKI